MMDHSELPDLPDQRINNEVRIKILGTIMAQGAAGRVALLQSFVRPIQVGLTGNKGGENGYFHTYGLVRTCQAVLEMCDAAEGTGDPIFGGFDRPAIEKLLADAMTIMTTPAMIERRKEAVLKDRSQALDAAQVYAFVRSLKPKPVEDQAEEAARKLAEEERMITELFI